MNLDELKDKGLAPEWMTEEGYFTLTKGYLINNETPLDMYRRVASAAASYCKNDTASWEAKFFDAMWKNWLCIASPIASNMGTDRGLPISCNTIHVGDSVSDIFNKNTEFAILSKNGAGVGIYLGDIRGRGAPIKGNGKSEGVIPWAKVFDITTAAINQGATRRGASALYLPVEHGDIDEFLNIRRATGDVNMRCHNSNHAVTISDAWMKDMVGGNKDKRAVWETILRTRVETGEPYLMFTDHVNNNSPECYKQNNLVVKSSNICSEITLYTDNEHSFVCCLSSMNLLRWEEWKDTDVIETSVRFLDCVLEEYIVKAKNVPFMEASVRSAIKGRAIGLGVLGWHSLLQSRMLPFDSFDAMMLNATIFRTMRARAEAATAQLAIELGEPEWCKGFGRRNSHVMAVAPTVSNSTISGGLSAGVEPMTANIYAVKGAKGTFIRKNKYLEILLAYKRKNTDEVWKSINAESGSVVHLDFLSKEEKDVFLTAREINQHAVIKQAAQRQKWVDQAQSINLFFGSNAAGKYIHEVHLAAWEQGLKTLYYYKSDGVIRGDLASRSKDECASCEA